MWAVSQAVGSGAGSREGPIMADFAMPRSCRKYTCQPTVKLPYEMAVNGT